METQPCLACNWSTWIRELFHRVQGEWLEDCTLSLMTISQRNKNATLQSWEHLAMGQLQQLSTCGCSELRVLVSQYFCALLLDYEVLTRWTNIFKLFILVQTWSNIGPHLWSFIIACCMVLSDRQTHTHACTYARTHIFMFLSREFTNILLYKLRPPPCLTHPHAGRGVVHRFVTAPF